MNQGVVLLQLVGVRRSRLFHLDMPESEDAVSVGEQLAAAACHDVYFRVQDLLNVERRS
jgi:hypothetical protein